MKILITGANGFTGMHLCVSLIQKGFDVHALARGESRLPVLDKLVYHPIELTSVRSLLKIFEQVSPDVVIHTAAMSKPDICETHREDCLKISLYTLFIYQQILFSVRMALIGKTTQLHR